MTRYRLEWSSGTDGLADAWTIVDDSAGAREQALRLLTRTRQPVFWVRVVLIGVVGDLEDRFLQAEHAQDWDPTDPLPPRIDGEPPVAAPDRERRCARALAALDVVLAWSVGNGILTAAASKHLSLVFDAAVTGANSVLLHDPAPTTRRRSRRTR